MDAHPVRLETRELEYFVALAEELHFSRAAEKVGIAQPPLSRAIANLERRVGVPLFERTSRSVRLTPSGTAMLGKARSALLAIEQTTTTAREACSIRLALPPGAGTEPLRAIMRSYARTTHAATVEITFSQHPGDLVREGQANLALVCDTDDLTGLHTLEVAQEHPVALLPQEHPYATRALVTIPELRATPCFADTCPPVPLDELIDTVAFGQLVVIVGEGAGARSGRGVVAVPVAGAAPMRLVLAWKDEPLPAVAAFLGTADRYRRRTALEAVAS